MIKRSRNFYDTTIIYLFICGKEHLLPSELVSTIPLSTQATWRNYQAQKFVGYKQQHILDEGIKKVELYQKYRHIKQTLYAVEKIYVAVANMLDSVKTKIYTINEHREKVIDIIQLYKQTIDFNKLLCFFRISRSTYQSWLFELKIKCTDSPLFLCARRYGTQLLKTQADVIYNALTSDTYKHWPVTSIAAHFQRTGKLHISLNTWYKYQKLLGLKRSVYKKHKKTKGIISNKPNEYWHIDITRFVTGNGTKHFIYFLSDNFSRKILAWRISDKESWEQVKECIADAYQLAYSSQKPCDLTIVSDGGHENTHQKLIKYINTLDGNIKKAIALKDISFSNSPAEARNKTFKSYYASERYTENTQQLIEKIIFFVHDFNTLRPNKPTGGFTPDEVYFDKKPQIDFAALRKQDVLMRIAKNRNMQCNACCNIQ
ncbi:MAG: DDE-type integrase/transposase/recombinase [Bacteroidia bacterium]